MLCERVFGRHNISTVVVDRSPELECCIVSFALRLDEGFHFLRHTFDPAEPTVHVHVASTIAPTCILNHTFA